jgi:pimeloyl-ACP methyl ester carboxylesterase
VRESLRPLPSDVAVGPYVFKVKTAGAGEPLVVLHHSTGPFWSPFHDAMAKHFRLVAPDLPGYGQSPRIEQARSARDLAISCWHLIWRLFDEPIHLIGFGLGGWVAAEMATINYPQLRSLTLVGAVGLRPDAGLSTDTLTSDVIAYARMGFSTDERFETEFGTEPAQVLRELWDQSREMTARIAQWPCIWSESLASLLPNVTTPTLVVTASEDRILPPEVAQRFHEHLPNSQRQTVRGGHVLDLESPHELAAVVTRFFRQKVET